jgi:hypothetical protein
MPGLLEAFGMIGGGTLEGTGKGWMEKLKEDSIRDRETNLLRLRGIQEEGLQEKSQAFTKGENKLAREQAAELHKVGLTHAETLQEAKIAAESGRQSRQETSEMDRLYEEGLQKLDQIRLTADLTPHKYIASSHLLQDTDGNTVIVGVTGAGDTKVLYTGGKPASITAAEMKVKESGLKLAIQARRDMATDEEINNILSEHGIKKWVRSEVPGKTVKTGGIFGIGSTEEPVTTFGPAPENVQQVPVTESKAAVPPKEGEVYIGTKGKYVFHSGKWGLETTEEKNTAKVLPPKKEDTKSAKIAADNLRAYEAAAEERKKAAKEFWEPVGKKLTLPPPGTYNIPVQKRKYGER